VLPGGTWSDPPEAQHDPSAVLSQDPSAVLPQDPEAVLPQDPEAVLPQDPEAVLSQDPEAVLPHDPAADEHWQHGSCWAGFRVATAWAIAVKTAGSVIPRFVQFCQEVVEISQRSRNAKGGWTASRTLHSSFSRGAVQEQVVQQRST
jgi:hypothetical protein